MLMPGAKVAKVVLFTCPHPRLLFRTVDVIIAAKMEDAMRQQMRELCVQRMPEFGRLARRRWQCYGYVAEERFIRHTLYEVIGLIRERKHVCRLIDAEELQVHPPHFVVIGDQQRHARPTGDALTQHDAPGQFMQRPNIERGLVQRDFDGDVVGDGVPPLLLREDFDGMACRRNKRHREDAEDEYTGCGRPERKPDGRTGPN